MIALDRFAPATREWFRRALGEPTDVQIRGWAEVAAGRHTLMAAPTGSGKTLAAFLWCLDRLLRGPEPAASTVPARPGAAAPDGGAVRSTTRVVYVSPIKALAYDLEKNLRTPLAGIGGSVTIDVRTGDTSAKERARQLVAPAQILITTPESLYLLLAGRSRARLAEVDTVIIDEIHALAGGKRGVHLALSLERLERLVTAHGSPEPQRIGLSATQRPLSEVARYLGGDRPVAIVDASSRPALDLQIVVPAQDMVATPTSRARPATSALPNGSAVGSTARGREDAGGMWPLIYPRLLDLVLAHRTTIIFVNSRRLAERIAQELNQLAAKSGRAPENAELARAHHGSVARHARVEIEDAMKAGRLRAIVATSSLELGIDMGAVDLVIQVESPGAVARGLQRIGRAGHHVGGTSRGRIIPKFRGDLLEAAVVARGMLDGAVEAVRIPDNALDVLAQQIVAMVAVEPWSVPELERVIRRAASYRDLSRAAFVAVLDMLAGRYPSDAFAELRPRLVWDRQADVLTARRGAALIAVTSGGTIPDRGSYGVHVGENGPRVGELDEEMVAESRPGETFVLGATTWRIEAITRDRVVVRPAPGEPGKMPFWRGEGPGRPVELGVALGAFCRELDGRLAHEDPAVTHAWLRADYALDDHAATNVIAYLAEQRAHAGGVPSDRAITIERFRDELGDVRVCILSPFGGRVHAPWALVLARQLEDRLGYPVHPMWTDDGIALRFVHGDVIPDDAALILDPDTFEHRLVDELARSSVFASQFRQNAARALLLPRRRPGQRTPLWAQRLRAQQLMAVALAFPQFPITLETYRECLRDIFDVPALVAILRQLRSGEIRVEAAETAMASPFARSLVFDYVAAFLYEGDAPVAERKAQALTLDRGLLRELIGGGELRELLDSSVIADLDSELQRTAEDRRARDRDELHDLLRRLGDLSIDELRVRCVGVNASVGVSELISAQLAVEITIAGQHRIIDSADQARYRGILGSPTPTPEPDALISLIRRYAKTHSIFSAEAIAERWALPLATIEPVLILLETRGELVRGELRPGSVGIDNCDQDVLRTLRRRTLVKLRAEVAPVSPATFAAFLPRWHGLDQPRRGIGALRDAIARLEGVALPMSELESRILPARIADYHPRMLDELGAAGELVWVGAGALGARDGRVILLRRARAAGLAPPAQPIAGDGVLHAAITAHLATAGASFLVALEAATRASRADVTAALWQLVWAGVVTNDTFAPLRSLAAPATRRGSGHAPRAGTRARPAALPNGSAVRSPGGRWSLVASFGAPPTATNRAHMLAEGLLERWGIASRAAARSDELPGGFAVVGDVLRAMEDAGVVRRGYFVAELEGAQFAWPGAIDRLRERPRHNVDLLAALDPACAWGSALPWPALRDPAARPARRVGAAIAQVDGELALWIEPRGHRIATAAVGDEQVAHALAVALPALAVRQRRRELLVETIDGTAASSSPWAAALVAAGARLDYRGLVVTPR